MGLDAGCAMVDIASVEPLLATRNAQGEIEGVKYGQITTVLVNAVKEQQQQIEEQRKQLEEQQRQINSLKQIVCLQNRKADICHEINGRLQ